MATTRTDKDTAIFEQQPPLRALGNDERTRLVESSDYGVLATIGRNGFPHQSTVLYTWDPATATARITTRVGRVKARNVAADERASLFVEGPDRWSFVVAEGRAEITPPSLEPGDATGLELLAMFPQPGPTAETAFLALQVAEQRVVLRLHVARLYGDIIELVDD